MKFTFHFNRFPFFAVLLVGLTILLQGCFKDKNATEEVCDNTCQYAYDGQCDDGGPNSLYSLCDCGTDCADCGTREVSDNDCLDGSSSSSSSSSSSGGGFQNIDGYWGDPSNGVTLKLCGNNRYQLIILEQAGGAIILDDQGTWSVSGSVLNLVDEAGNGYRQFTVQQLDLVNGMLVLKDGTTVWNCMLYSDDPCLGLGSSSGGSSSGGSSSSSSSGGSSSSSSSGGPVSCGTTVTDIDGNTYQVVQIGNQCWMASNLRTTRYRNGNSIQQGAPCNPAGENPWAEYSNAYWAYPGCDVSNLSRDGLLYTRAVILDPSGICPNGWHVPTRAEYQELIDYLDEGTVGTNSWNIAIPKLKSTNGWYGDDISGGTGTYYNNGTNSSGFTAYPAVRVNSFGVSPAGLDGYWYDMDPSYSGGVGMLHMEAVPQWLLNGSNYTEGSLGQISSVTASCRCVKD